MRQWQDLFGQVHCRLDLCDPSLGNGNSQLAVLLTSPLLNQGDSQGLPENCVRVSLEGSDLDEHAPLVYNFKPIPRSCKAFN